jgi:acyl transferase domain-containing protein
VLNEVKANKTPKPDQPFKGYKPPETPKPDQPFKGYSSNETTKIDPEFIKQFPPKKNTKAKQEAKQEPKQEAKQEAPQEPKQEAKQNPEQEVKATAKEVEALDDETKKALKEAEELKKRGRIEEVVALIKKHPKLAIFAPVLLGLTAYFSSRNKGTPKQEAQPIEQPAPQQPAPQQPAPQQQAPAIAQPTNFASEYDEELKQTQTQMLNLFQELEKHRQIYEETAQNLMQANELYEKQLLGILPTIPLLLAKTPLNNMTNEDLLQHTSALFSSMPYSTALQSVDKLMKGYYIAKMNGVDPKTLTTTDLIEIAKNPVLAKSTDENLAQFLSQIGEVLKYKIKSNLDKIGVVKDAYDLRLKELQEIGKIYKDTITSIKDRFSFQRDMEKLNITIEALNQKTKIAEENIKAKKGEKQQGGQKFDLKGFSENLNSASQVCPPDPNFPNLPNLECMKEKGLIK